MRAAVRTPGLVGGMSWESTLTYYRLLNREARERLGGLHSAPLLMHSVDFGEVAPLQEAGRWDEIGERLAGVGRSLAQAGAEGIVLCSNSMHKVAEEVEREAGVPLLHIADASGHALREVTCGKVGLLGTRFTMEEEFYTRRLRDGHGLKVLVPDLEQRQAVHAVIYGELCRGETRTSSRRLLSTIMAGLVAEGAEAILLACTELPLLLGPEDAPVPVIDTVEAHVRYVMDWALGSTP